MTIRWREDRNRWQIDVNLNGVRKKTLFKGLKSEAKKKEAELLAQLQGIDRKGNLPAKNLSLKQLFEPYLKHCRIRNKDSYHPTRRANLFMKYFGENKEASDINQNDLENYILWRKEKEVKESTINRDLAALKAAYEMAIKSQLLTYNPVKSIRFFNENKFQRNRIITREEFDRLIKEASLHFKTALMLGYYTGMRQGEILGLQWSNVDLSAKYIKIHAAETKTQKGREVPIHPDLLNYLSCLDKSESKFVVNFKDKKVGSIQVAINATRRRANIFDFRFHDLRHTFATNLFLAGAREFEVMQITGHTSGDMLKRYVNLTSRDVRRFFD